MKFLDELQSPDRRLTCTEERPPAPCVALPLWRPVPGEYCSECLAAGRPCSLPAELEEGEIVENADEARHSRSGKPGEKEPVELEVRVLIFGISILF